MDVSDQPVRYRNVTASGNEARENITPRKKAVLADGQLFSSCPAALCGGRFTLVRIFVERPVAGFVPDPGRKPHVVEKR